VVLLRRLLRDESGQGDTRWFLWVLVSMIVLMTWSVYHRADPYHQWLIRTAVPVLMFWGLVFGAGVLGLIWLVDRVADEVRKVRGSRGADGD